MPERNGIFYTDSGKGFPVVFIHGFCETHSIWDSFIVPVEKTYRVISIDLPGFGRSKFLKAPFSIDDVAEVVLSFLDSIDIKEFIVIGHSLGGYVTLAMAKQAPLRVKAFGLFHSTAFGDTPEKQLSRNKVIEFVEANGVEPFIKSFIPPLFYNQSSASIPPVVDIALTTPKETLIEYTAAMRDRPERLAVLEGFKGNVLFIVGEKDGVFTPESIDQQVHLAPQSMVFKFKDVAHMGMFEAEEPTQQAVLTFLKKALE